MRTVKILGTEYRIIEEEFKDEECDGYCDYTSKEIHIRNDNVNNVGDFDNLMKHYRLNSTELAEDITKIMETK